MAQEIEILNEYFDNDLTNPDAELGFNNGIKYEPNNAFVYNEAPCEKVYEGHNNTYIVLGRDRFGPWDDGAYGSLGEDKAGAIDIVAGRLSAVDATKLTGKKVNPSFGADAARIYLSQKSDIDTYFHLVPGRTDTDAGRATSAIALKADNIRLISRNTFKIVTGTDAKLSNGDPALLKVGVQLIANNSLETLQPIPKGDNLVLAFRDLDSRLKELGALVTALMEIQKEYNKKLGSHTHYSPFYGALCSPSVDAEEAAYNSSVQMHLKIDQGTKNFLTNLDGFERTFLDGGDKYINSAYHFLN